MSSLKARLTLFVIFSLALVLRLYHLDQNPPALYWDEASLGYNAFSISQTLRDEHGIFLPVTHFIAFGDYKPPLYIYTAALTTKLLGFNEFSTRLPSALSGSLLALIAPFLVLNFLRLFNLSSKKEEIVALVAGVLVAISPWSLQMSRAAFEANLATLFSAIGVFFFLRLVSSPLVKNALLSALFFALPLYTFNSHRVFVPLLVGLLLITFLKKVVTSPKSLALFLISFLLFVAPTVPHMLSPEGKLRFNEVTWLNNLDIIKASNEQISLHGNTLLAKIVYNRRIYYLGEFSKHYLDHFRPDFLFVSGDVNPRLSTRTHGLLYPVELLFLVAGLVSLYRRSKRGLLFFLAWWALSIIPASLARETPHALRILPVLPVPQILTAFGITALMNLKAYFPYLSAVVAIIYAIGFGLYTQDYHLIYPQTFSSDWQYGYKQAVQSVAKLSSGYEYVSVTNRLGRPYIYFLYYNSYPPEKYWQVRQSSRDSFGFWSTASFDKYYFSDPPPSGKTLFLRAPDEIGKSNKIIETILDLQGKPVFVLYE